MSQTTQIEEGKKENFFSRNKRKLAVATVLTATALTSTASTFADGETPTSFVPTNVMTAEQSNFVNDFLKLIVTAIIKFVYTVLITTINFFTQDWVISIMAVLAVIYL